jgi:hypothetical protein
MCFFLVSRCFFPSDQEQQKTKKKNKHPHTTPTKKQKELPKALCVSSASQIFFFFSSHDSSPALRLLPSFN